MDTVGFVRRLPTQLIEAFKSTLEEVGEADLILHVVDGSHPDPFSQIDAVNEVLSDIEGVGNIPVVIAFNKADMMDEAARETHRRARARGAYRLRRHGGRASRRCGRRSSRCCRRRTCTFPALLPYTAGSLLSRVREYGKVESVEYRGDGVMLEAEVDGVLAAQIVEQSIG